jgi:molybdopterin synthase catalytic subunit
MSIFSDNFGIILSSTLGAIGTFFGFFRGKKVRESNANIEIGKAYELMAKQNNSFIESMTEKMNHQTKEIQELKIEVTALREENKLLLGQLKKYRK